MARLAAMIHPQTLTFEAVRAALDPGTLRGLGLSWRKAATVLELAQRIAHHHQ